MTANCEPASPWARWSRRIAATLPRSVEIQAAGKERRARIGYVIEGTLAKTQVIDPVRAHIVALPVPTNIHGRLFDGPCSFRINVLSAATHPVAEHRRHCRKTLVANRFSLLCAACRRPLARKFLFAYPQ